ncbi:MAG: hypothetical protein RIR98_1825, partial [Bacteroidota bacterium]
MKLKHLLLALSLPVVAFLGSCGGDSNDPKPTISLTAGAKFVSSDISVMSDSLLSFSISATSGSDIFVGGNWTNNGTGLNFFPNNRAVIFNGTTAQTLGGTNSTVNPFAFLFLDNNAGLTLTSNQQVNTLFEFTNGQVTLGAFNFTLAGTNTPINI